MENHTELSGRRPGREAVKTAFLQLLEERPLWEITVKDIVQRCGVNRNTFYYHYKDIPALLQEIVEEQTRRIIADQPRSLPDCLEAAASFALEHRRIVLHISQSAHREVFERRLMALCRRTVRSYAAAAFDSCPISEEDQEILIRFYQCECFGQIIEWLDSGMHYDMRRQFRRLCQLGEGMTELLLRRAAGDAGPKGGGPPSPLPEDILP